MNGAPVAVVRGGIILFICADQIRQQVFAAAAAVLGWLTRAVTEMLRDVDDKTPPLRRFQPARQSRSV